MKQIINKIGIYAAAALSMAVCFTACQDEPDRFQLADGTPTVYYVRPVKAAAKDSLLTSAYMGNSICLVGDNLRSVYKLVFNDQQAVLNNSYITDHTLLVDIPNEIPNVVSNKMYLINKNADTVKVDFQVLVPGPSISSLKNEFASAGSVTSLYGDYFVDDPNVPLEVLVGTIPATIKSYTKGAINFVIPDTAVPNTPITVKTIYGTAKSVFYWQDSRGMLFNFDTDGHPANHGWHAQVIETDATALDGNFLRLGDPSVTLDAEGGWNDSNFSFEYWPGDWTTPISYNDSPLLTDYADFSDFANMALKFEMYVPTSNPWMSGSMQLIVGGVEKISGSSAGVDIYGNNAAGANNTWFNNSTLPRGLYTPWASTGTYDTGDEWLTVSVPYANFIYGFDGTLATGAALAPKDFTSLTIFVCGGGLKGTECNPVIKIDNIRAVPIK